MIKRQHAASGSFLATSQPSCFCLVSANKCPMFIILNLIYKQLKAFHS